MLTKAIETVKVFTRQRPSLSALARSRRRRFDDVDPILPSTVAAGETVTGTVPVFDEYERLLTDFEESFRVACTDAEATVPDRVTVDEGDDGVGTIADVTFRTPGFQYLTLVREADGQRFHSNPVEVTEGEPDYRLYWGDIHLHSQFSDGAGTMTKGLRFGRDVIALDVAAYTDHDTMGFFIPPQLQRRRMHRRYFDRMQRVTDAFNDPGEFVTLCGYEWTKQPNRGGHVNVYFPDTEGAELFDSLSPETNSYEKLWRTLRAYRAETGNDVLTIPHHPAEAMYPFDFSAVEFDDELAPLVEVYSQWGSSERPEGDGNRQPLAMGQGEIDTPGHYAQDALALGDRVGLMGSSDFHGPRPGRSNIHLDPHLPTLREIWEDGIGWGHIWRVWSERSYAGGLTGFYAPELTREAIFESLRSRRVYATSQPHRLIVDFRVDGQRVGEKESTVVVDGPAASRTVELRVAGTAPLARATVVKNNENWRVFEPSADTASDKDAPFEAYTLERTVEDDAPITGMDYASDGTGGEAARSDRESVAVNRAAAGEEADVYYLRVRQVDGGSAWAGPIWVEQPS